MPVTSSLNLTVPVLPDNDVWFANNASWQNYWSNIELTFDFDGVDNTIYVESAYDNTLAVLNLDVGGVIYQVATLAQLNSLIVAYQTLNTNYKLLRDEMKAASYLTNSQ